jgi:integrase
LTASLRKRANPGSDEITRGTLVKVVADLWLEEITAEERLMPQTIHRYRSNLRSMILPALGRVKVGDVGVGRLDRLLRGIAVDRPYAARAAKAVLGQMFNLAVRHGAIPANPVRDTGRLRRPRRQVVVLDEAGLHQVRACIRAWQNPDDVRYGPRPTSDLADTVDLMLATGVRIGEALAVRWRDLDLAADPATLTASGTLVHVAGVGLVRQDWPKSAAGFRTLVLPTFAVDMLTTRLALRGSFDAVFPSRVGTWLSPWNWRRQWRAARAGTGLEWVTPHTFRKTVATLIDSEVDARSAAAQLGHSRETVTSTYYIAKPRVAPDVSDTLQKLAESA